MNRRTGCVQFATERIVVSELAVIRLRVSVGGGADVLKFCPGQRRFVGRQCARARCLTRREQKDGDKDRENG